MLLHFQTFLTMFFIQIWCFLLQCRGPWFDSWVRKIHWRRDRLPTPVFLGFHIGSSGKEPAYNVGDLDSIPGLVRSPEEGKGYPLQYSGLENSMDCVVHGVTKSRTWLSEFHFHLLKQKMCNTYDLAIEKHVCVHPKMCIGMLIAPICTRISIQ